MSDIFNEVDEEVRREQLARIWKQYGNLILAVALLVVVGVGGWRAYQYFETEKAAKAGAVFESGIALADQGKVGDAEAIFTKLASEGPSGYRALARIRAAETLIGRDKDAALKAFDAIAADSSARPEERDIAALRAAYLIADSASYDDIKARLEPLTQANRPFVHSARDLLALKAWRAGNAAAAREWANTILGDTQSPANLRTRAEILLALLPPAAKS